MARQLLPPYLFQPYAKEGRGLLVPGRLQPILWRSLSNQHWHATVSGRHVEQLRQI